MCLLSTFCFSAYCIIIINFIFNVSNYHAFDLNPLLGAQEGANLSKTVYVNEILFGCGITSIKLSLLWFYYNLFSIKPIMRRVIQGTGVACAMWFLTVTFVVIFQCTPVQALWKQGASLEYCLAYPRLLLGYELSNLFLDVAILCIPTSVVPQLQLSSSKKAGVLGIFLLGALYVTPSARSTSSKPADGSRTCVFSILRITAIWHPSNLFLNFDFAFCLVWATLELGLAIVCSCLPFYGPLVSAITKPMPYIRSWYSSLKSNPATGQSSGSRGEVRHTSEDRAYLNLGDNHDGTTTQTWTSYKKSSAEDHEMGTVPTREMMVRRDVDMA
ncbi:hypothetical protein F4780DRAFT_297052 [Xylariomycetidae sp. FL0641]|nr:hypothetical protein F4780DRAFT_297052 [Xylariomycetidae sp. FL0641]